MTPDDFIAALLPGAKACELKHCIPTGFTIAQAALESGWATSRLSRAAYNLFGIKAQAGDGWEGATCLLPTKEQDKHGNEHIVMARWRVYRDWAECLDDRARFFHDNRRYRAALECTTSIGFAQAVADAGYATDIHYADKLISIINQHNLEDA